MRYLEKSFTVAPGSSKNYRDNYDAVFGKKSKPQGPALCFHVTPNDGGKVDDEHVEAVGDGGPELANVNRLLRACKRPATAELVTTSED